MLATQLNLLINHNGLPLHMQILMPHVDELGGAVGSWLPGYCPRLRSERSEFEPHWPKTLCCVLGQDTLISRCLAPCIYGYR